jgi:glycine cleavage system H protein
MSSVRFTEDHEWLRLEDDGTVTIGITDYAQDQLGDIVYIELPNVGDMLSSGSEAAVIESVKAAGEIKTAIGGEVLAVNNTLADKPEAVNLDPTDSGWFFKLAPDDVDELDQFMDEETYQEFIKDL